MHRIKIEHFIFSTYIVSIIQFNLMHIYKDSKMSRHYIYSAIFGSILCSFGPWGLASAADVKNVVIVHGALVDGSGWRAVSDGLTKKG
jgi:hypothetical protein